MSSKQKPNRIDIEDAILGIVLSIPSAQRTLAEIKASEFTDERNAALWSILVEMFAAGDDIADTTLRRVYQQRLDVSDDAAGASRIMDLRAKEPNSANLKRYVGMLREENARDAARIACDAFATEIEEEDPSEAIERLYGRLNASNSETPLAAVSCKDMAKAALDETVASEGLGIRTGYDQLDGWLGGGLSQTSFTVLAAGPSFGKSALAVNMLKKMRLPDDRPARVLYVSMEMGNTEIFDRMCCIVGHISTQAVRMLRAGIEEPHVEAKYGKAYAAAVQAVAQMGHKIKAGRIVSINQFRMLMAMHAHEIDVAVLDYIQQLRPTYQGQQTMERVNEASWSCKEMAMKYRVPVIALSQLNRDGYKDGNKPGLANLRETGQLEQDADNVWMLWREKEEEADREDMELFVAKNRSGQLGRILLDFKAKYGVIESPSPAEYQR